MADTGKQSPLGVNVLGGILKNDCLQINVNAASFMGASKNNAYYIPGRLVNDTVLRLITWSINWGWHCGRGNGPARLTNSTYNNQISIGKGVIPALGNAAPETWYPIDPQGVWAGTTQGGTYGPTGEPAKSIQWANANGFSNVLPGPATAGYSIYDNIDSGQFATWYPYNTSNPNHGITQWGWVRCLALQAWNEFNYHGRSPTQSEPKYEDFCGSFMSADSFIASENSVISAGVNAEGYADGTFSNITDVVTADIAGVTRATEVFGEELDRIGNLFDPRKLDRFGFPSTLLQTLYENGAIVSDLNLALGAAGLSGSEISKISSGTVDYVTNRQERAIYTAFLTIRGQNLLNTLASCRVKTYIGGNTLSDRVQGLTAASGVVGTYTGNDRYHFRTLADALDPQFLFPASASSLTVPIYNDQANQLTGSKFYYLIYNGSPNSSTVYAVNSALSDTAIKDRIGTLFSEGTPPAYADTTDRNNDAYDTSGQGASTYVAPKGFDSYLGGTNIVLPAKVGLAVGAFRYSMLQVNNITNITPGHLGQCISHLESISPADSALLTTPPTFASGGTTPQAPLGEGDFNYRIYTNSEPGFDFIRLYHNGTLITSANGYEGDGTSYWEAQGEFAVKEDDIIKIEYVKDSSISFGTDTGYIEYCATAGEQLNGLAVQTQNLFEVVGAGTASSNLTGASENHDNSSTGYVTLRVKVNADWQAAWLEENAPDDNYAHGAIPVNTQLQSEIPKKIGIGSGPDGRYTHSDFFGCMSGLPYAWNDIFNDINSTGASQPVAKSVLNKNYEQLYLGNTWEKAAIKLRVIPYEKNVLPSLSNPANPAYDPREEIPNPDFDPEQPPSESNPEEIANPDYDDFKYIDAYTNVRTNYMFTFRVDDLYYRTEVGGLIADGGGYCRGGAPYPKVIIAPNNTKASASVSIGQSNADASPYEPGPIHAHKFGRVASISTNNGTGYRWLIGLITHPLSETDRPSDARVQAYNKSNCPSESIEVEAPPTGTYTAYYSQAKNQGGDLWRTPIGGGTATIAIQGANAWPNPGNAFCQRYITDANTEINKIFNGTSGNNAQVPALNINWDVTGRQLKVEQRSRYIGLGQVEVPRDPFVNSYETLSTFVDSMPAFAQQILPHMAAPTIEMIVDRFCAGGVSAVAMMREDRNADRLANCGIPLENTIPDAPTEDRLLTLLYNGTVQGAPEGIPINGTTWTNPSWPYNPGIDSPPSPTPGSVYVSPYIFTGNPGPGTGINPIILNIDNPQVGPYTVTGPFFPGPITPVDPGEGGPGGETGGGGGGTGGGGGGSEQEGGGGGGTGSPGGPVLIEPTESIIPNLVGPGAGPSGPLNSVPTVDEAIQYVIHCNCDCWDALTNA